MDMGKDNYNMGCIGDNNADDNNVKYPHRHYYWYW